MFFPLMDGVGRVTQREPDTYVADPETRTSAKHVLRNVKSPATKSPTGISET